MPDRRGHLSGRAIRERRSRNMAKRTRCCGFRKRRRIRNGKDAAAVIGLLPAASTGADGRDKVYRSDGSYNG